MGVNFDAYRGLKEITVTRCYCYNLPSDPIMGVEMHSFSDASARLYATCVYLRFRLKSGQFKISLVTGKSKIMDANKVTTVPRSELNGGVLMCQVFSEIFS